MADVAYAEKGTSAIAEVQKVKAASPDVVMPASYTADAILYMKTFKDLNYVPQAILAMDAGYISDEFKKTLWQGRESCSPARCGRWTREEEADDRAGERDLQEAFRPRHERQLRPLLHRLPLVLADAINNAGSTDPEKIRESLEKYSFPETG